MLMQNELRPAPVKPGLFHNSTDAETLVPFVLFDLGAGCNHLDMAGMQRSWVEMVSVGPRLTCGLPLVRDGHTGPFLSPQFGTRITF